MKYIKKINESTHKIYTDEVILSTIEKQYTYNKLKEMYSDELKDWSSISDEMLEQTAKDIILSSILSWFENKYIELDEDDYLRITNMLKMHYDFLN